MNIVVSESSTMYSKMMVAKASMNVDASVPEGDIRVSLTGCGYDCRLVIAHNYY